MSLHVYYPNSRSNYFQDLHSFSMCFTGEHIVIFGGVDSEEQFQNMVYQFDLKTKKWVYIDLEQQKQFVQLKRLGNRLQENQQPTNQGTINIIPPRYKHTATTISNDKLLIVSGFGNSTVLNDIWVYHVHDMKFEKLIPIESRTYKEFIPRFGHIAFIRENELFVMFGMGGAPDIKSCRELKDCYVYSIEENLFKDIQIFNRKEWMKGTTITSHYISQEKELILGSNLKKVGIFNIKSLQLFEFDSLGDIPSPRSRYSLCESTYDDEICLVGGSDKNQYYNEIYILQIPNNENKRLSYSWKQLYLCEKPKQYQEEMIFPGIIYHQSLLIDGGIMVFGGMIKTINYIQDYKKHNHHNTMQINFNNAIYYIDLKTRLSMDYSNQSVSYTADTKRVLENIKMNDQQIPFSTYQSSMAYWPLLGKMVIYGGIIQNQNSGPKDKVQKQYQMLDVLQLYDLEKKNWTIHDVKNSMVMANHRMIEYKDRLYLYGGIDQQDCYRDVFFINYDKKLFMMHVLKLRNLQIPRINPVMFVYGSDLFIFGGFSSIEGFSEKMFRVDLEKDEKQMELMEWSENVEVPKGRMYAGQCIQGKYLVMSGGIGANQNVLNDLWVFDCEKQRWIESVNMSQTGLVQLYGHSMEVICNSTKKQDLKNFIDEFKVPVDKETLKQMSKYNKKIDQMKKIQNQIQKTISEARDQAVRTNQDIYTVADSQKINEKVMEGSQKSRKSSGQVSQKSSRSSNKQSNKQFNKSSNIQSNKSSNKQSNCISEVDSRKLGIYDRNKEYLEGKWLTDAEEQEREIQEEQYLEILILGGNNSKKMEDEGEQLCTESSQNDQIVIRLIIVQNEEIEIRINQEYIKYRLKKMLDEQKKKKSDVMDIEEIPEKYVEDRGLEYQCKFQKDDYKIESEDNFGRIFMSTYRIGNKIYIQGGINDPNMCWIELMDRYSLVRKIEEVVDWSTDYFNPLYIVYNQKENHYYIDESIQLKIDKEKQEQQKQKELQEIYARKSMAPQKVIEKKKEEDVLADEEEMGNYYANKIKQTKAVKDNTKSMFEDFIGKYNQKQQIENMNKQNKLKKQNRKQEKKEEKVINEKEKKKVVTNELYGLITKNKGKK